MTRGRAVQIGSASELFERPRHTFVGHFIGSPGMNFLPARSAGGHVEVAGHRLSSSTAAAPPDGDGYTLGVRPEYVTLAAPHADGAVPALVTQAQDIGTYWLLTARLGDADGHPIRARLSPHQMIPKAGDAVWFTVLGPHTCFYRGETLVEEAVA
jgi:glycerol transport system ATP-binding protein